VPPAEVEPIRTDFGKQRARDQPRRMAHTASIHVRGVAGTPRNASKLADVAGHRGSRWGYDQAMLALRRHFGLAFGVVGVAQAGWSESDAEGIVVNPLNAVDFDATLAVEHQPVMSKTDRV
jgi:hypothetical protein